jgi:site-specific DNA recombinase
MQQHVTRTLGYVRVSGQEQETVGTSLEAQEARIKAYCSANGYPVPTIYREAESAAAESYESRKEVQKLYQTIRPGDLIIVDTRDRWSRDPIFFMQSTDEIHKKKGATFFSLQDRFNPEDRISNWVRAAISEEERRTIKRRTVGTRKNLRARGEYVEGLPPLGYTRAEKKGYKRADRILHIDQPRAELVKALFSRCLKGESIASMVEWLQETQTWRAWDKKTVGTILHSRVYMGETLTDAIKNGGVWVKAHDPIIDPATFAKVQEALAKRRKTPANFRAGAKTTDWVLRSFAKCKCGARMSARYGQTKRYYTCYRKITDKTACDAAGCEQEATDKVVSGMILARILELANELNMPRSAPKEQAAPDFAGQRKRLQDRRSRFQEMYADGNMTSQELTAKLKELDAAMLKVDATQADYLEHHKAQDPARLERLRTDVASLAKVWAGTTGAERREALQRLADGVRLELSETGPTAVITWKPIERLTTEVSRVHP